MTDLETWITENTGIINSVIGKYYWHNEFEDIKQVALMGLTKAQNEYNPNKSSFNTFAVACMRNEVNNYLKEVNNIYQNEILLDNFYTTPMLRSKMIDDSVRLNEIWDIIYNTKGKLNKINQRVIDLFLENPDQNKNNIDTVINKYKGYSNRVINKFKREVISQI